MNKIGSTVVGIDVGGPAKGFHAVALCGGSFMERSHGTTASEIREWWRCPAVRRDSRIPELGGKKAPPVFDYAVVASDEKNIVQIETKGTARANSGALTSVNLYGSFYSFRDS